MPSLHEQLGEEFFAQFKAIANRSKSQPCQVSSVTSSAGVMTSPTKPRAIHDRKDHTSNGNLVTIQNIDSSSSVLQDVTNLSDHLPKTVGGVILSKRDGVTSTTNDSPHILNLALDSNPGSISRIKAVDGATSNIPNATPTNSIQSPSGAPSMMKTSIQKQISYTQIKPETAEEKQFAFVKASLARLRITRGAAILAASNSDSPESGLQGVNPRTNLANINKVHDDNNKGFRDGEIVTQLHCEDPFFESKGYHPSPHTPKDQSIKAQVSDSASPPTPNQRASSGSFAASFIKSINNGTAAIGSRRNTHVRGDSGRKSPAAETIGTPGRVSHSTLLPVDTLKINPTTGSPPESERHLFQASPGETFIDPSSTTSTAKLKVPGLSSSAHASPVLLREKSTQKPHRSFEQNGGFVKAKSSLHNETLHSLGDHHNPIAETEAGSQEPSHERQKSRHQLTTWKSADLIHTPITKQHSDADEMSHSIKQDPMPFPVKAQQEVRHIPVGLINHLERTGIIPSDHRPIMKSHKGKDPCYIYTKYLLDNRGISSPYEIFDKAARSLKAANRSHTAMEDKSIIHGSKLNYDLPPWVSMEFGRLYVWKCARNLRLGMQPLTKSEYESLASNYARDVKTYRELDADEAFERGDWDVAAELRKPENRDAILEHERQLQENHESHDMRLFNYEDYVPPETFKMRTIECQSRTTLEHQVSSNKSIEDLPPKDYIRLDIDFFVKADALIETNTFDAVENRYPECKVPVYPLWKSAASIKSAPPRKKISSPSRSSPKQTGAQDLPLLNAPPMYWDERRKDDIAWITKIQRPTTIADLNAHGCYLYMNPGYVQQLNSWLDGVIDLVINDACIVDVTSEGFRSGRCIATGLVRPHYHYPDELFGESADGFYAPPYNAPELDEISYAEDKGFDPIQSHDEQLPWNVDHSIACHCRVYLSFLSQQYKLLKKRDRTPHIEKGKKPGQILPDSPTVIMEKTLDPFHANEASIIIPEISMYVRPTTAQDAEAVLNIYNHWSQHSNSVPCNNLRDGELFNHMLSTTSYHELPFFVACSSKNYKHKRSKRGDISPRENIIGISFALPWSTNATFAQTYEIFIFSSPEESYRRQGIANVLLDRVMTALDKTYSPQFPTRCYESGLEVRHFQPGGMRGSAVARKVLANIYYTDNEIASMLWKKDWLTRWSWKTSAMISEIGKGKDGDVLHLLTMSYDVGRDGERARNHIEGETWKLWPAAGAV